MFGGVAPDRPRWGMRPKAPVSLKRREERESEREGDVGRSCARSRLGPQWRMKRGSREKREGVVSGAGPLLQTCVRDGSPLSTLASALRYCAHSALSHSPASASPSPIPPRPLFLLHPSFFPPSPCSFFPPELAAARARLAAATSALSESQSALASVERELSLDLGLDSAYSGMLPGSGSTGCLSLADGKYTYELCPFGSAAQLEGGARTSLGEFAGWEEGHKVMAFRGGSPCWNGPARSVRARVECGPLPALTGIAEPNRCEYEARLATPAACDPAEAERLGREAEEAEAEARAAAEGKEGDHDEL